MRRFVSWFGGKRRLAIFVIILIAAYFFMPRGNVSGIVLDKVSDNPIEGVYVVAIYSTGGSDGVHSYSWCARTKGMYTGKDGKFSFPLERYGRPSLAAIKRDYVSDGYGYPRRGDGTVKTYSEPIFHMHRQDPAKPEFKMGGREVSCTRDAWRDDVEASLEFLRIGKGELERLGADEQTIRYQSDLLKEHENLAVHVRK